MILVSVASIAARRGMMKTMDSVFYFGKMGIHSQRYEP